jgi:prevent-host-death family protein
MYNIRQAQKNLEKLLREAARGKEVIIARNKTPVAKLKAIVTAKSSKARTKSR